jgi:hypothetical protein
MLDTTGQVEIYREFTPSFSSHGEILNRGQEVVKARARVNGPDFVDRVEHLGEAQYPRLHTNG